MVVNPYMASSTLQNGYYRLEVKIKNRKEHSAVACASYRSDEELYSERDGLTKSFRPHKVKPESFIMKPEHAPEWALDREKLWNEVEKIEPHPSAQLAREVLLSIPKELDEKSQTELVKKFVNEQFINAGMVADVSIHRDEEHNPHAHVLLTMRSFDLDGKWENKSKRIQKLDENGNPIFNDKGQRVTVSVKTNDWSNPNNINIWRESWAKHLNEVSKEKGLELKFSEKSFEKQGFEKLPLMRLTRQEYYLEKKAKQLAKQTGKEYEPVTYHGQQNKLIEEYNKLLLEEKATLKEIENAQKEIKYADPERVKALNFITEYNNRTPLTDREKQAYSSIRKRAKTDINFGVARKMFIDVSEGFFKKKVENTKDKLEAKKRYIKDVLRPEFDIDKGLNFSIGTNIDPTYFNEYVSEKINEVNDLTEEVNKLEKAHKELIENAKIVLARETKKVNDVFEFIYHDNIVDDKFKSPTLRYSASKSFIEDGVMAEVNRNYVGQKNVEKHYNQLARTKSLRDQFIELNNDLERSMFNYRISDRSIYKWIKHEADSINPEPKNGTHISHLENREMARQMVMMNREKLDELLPNLEEKYGIDPALTLKEKVEIITGEDVQIPNLYKDKNEIFTDEYDSQANRYKLINNEQYKQFNNMENPHTSNGIESVATSLFDAITQADNDHNYYKTKKKTVKVRGKYKTIDNENEL